MTDVGVAAAPEALVRVEGLAIGYRQGRGEAVRVLRGVDLMLRPGERVGVVGESGCGKSTLALALLGYLRPGGEVLAGHIEVAGRDLFAEDPRELRRLRGGTIALVPQNAGQSLTPTLRVGLQVAEGVTLHQGWSGRAAWADAVDLLGSVRLPDPERLARRYPHELSGGQQQRVAIAMALAGAPRLLVLDEPTTGLDVTTQAAVLDLLDDVRARTGVATLYISHDLGVIARVAERLVVMYAGEVVEEGTAVEVLARPAHPYTRGLLASVPRLSRPALPPALPGQAPRPGRWAGGCAFAPRCAWADERSRAVHPALVPIRIGGVDEGRLVRCHHWLRVAAGDGVTRAAFPSLDGRQLSDRPPILELERVAADYYRPGLGSTFGRLRGTPNPPSVVAEIDLTVREGETLALVGESGSGKSTLARVVAGLLPPVAGALRFRGAALPPSVETRTREQRRAIQLVFQNPDASLNPRQTVGQILDRPLTLFTGLGRRARRQRAEALLEEVRLDRGFLARYPAQLSGGEKQRVSIARAFAAEPALVLCDEPTSALDVSVQAAVLDLLRSLQAERGTAYLFVSHDLAVVRAVADRVAVLHQGRVVEVGSTTEVFARPHHPYTADLLAAVLDPLARSGPTRSGPADAATGPIPSAMSLMLASPPQSLRNPAER